MDLEKLGVGDSQCGHIVPLLDAFHDGEISGAEREQVSEHLMDCSICRVKLDEIGSVQAALRALPVFAPQRDYSLNFDALLKEKAEKQVAVDAAESASRHNWASGKRSRASLKKLAWGGSGIAAAVALAVMCIHNVNWTHPASYEIANHSGQTELSRTMGAPGHAVATNDVSLGARNSSQLDEPQRSNSLVAVYVPEQSSSITDEIGVKTDEDGLYEFKL